MTPDHDPEDFKLPPAMELFAKRNSREQLIAQETSTISRAGSEHIEKAILCDLWRSLGDHTETYWSAFQAARAFTAIDRFIFGELGEIPNEVRCHLLDAIAATLTEKARVMRQIQAKREELIRSHPLPGDP
jgi:hypothetical protein